jgi:hypothetical protein
MVNNSLHWLIHTDGGLLTRILVGVAIFMTFAMIDLRKNGRVATRWREYSVLLTAVLAALVYGAINDQITVTISPEYFLYGKELAHKIGDDPPMPQLRWEAAKIGLKATWTVGLIFGVCLLLANNPFRSLPRLRNRQLMMYIPMILLIAALCGSVGGFLGYRGFLTRFNSDFQDMVAVNLYRPKRFMSAWGVHLGDYIGGMLGTLAAIAFVVHRRLWGV